MPGIAEVRFEESGTGIDRQIVGRVDTAVFADGVITCDEAGIQVNWWPQPDERDWFQIHYWESSGFDCGWHRQENTHVDGDDHFRERESLDDEYPYEPVTYETETPVGILWEIADRRLVDRVSERHR